MTIPIPTASLNMANPKQRRTFYIWSGSAAALFVGIMWWKHKNNAAAAEAATATDTGQPPADSSYITDATPGADLTGGGIGGTGNTTDPNSTNAPTSNAEWTQAALQQLESAGYEPTSVLEALGLYLARQPVSDAQALIIGAAVAAEGPPPVGTYAIIYKHGGSGGGNPPPGGGGGHKPPPKPPSGGGKKPPKKPGTPAHWTVVVSNKRKTGNKPQGTLDLLGRPYHRSGRDIYEFNIRYRSATAKQTIEHRGYDNYPVGSMWWIPK